MIRTQPTPFPKQDGGSCPMTVCAITSTLGRSAALLGGRRPARTPSSQPLFVPLPVPPAPVLTYVEPRLDHRASTTTPRPPPAPGPAPPGSPWGGGRLPGGRAGPRHYEGKGGPRWGSSYRRWGAHS